MYCKYFLFTYSHLDPRISRLLVSELVGWVRNVVLINVYLDLENPGGSGFRVGGYMSQMREWRG
jgi:hypothetical protein